MHSTMVVFFFFDSSKQRSKIMCRDNKSAFFLVYLPLWFHLLLLPLVPEIGGAKLFCSVPHCTGNTTACPFSAILLLNFFANTTNFFLSSPVPYTAAQGRLHSFLLVYTAAHGLLTQLSTDVHHTRTGNRPPTGRTAQTDYSQQLCLSTTFYCIF